jgi:hypothetical protein
VADDGFVYCDDGVFIDVDASHTHEYLMLTVACVWVDGHLPYQVEYVTRLHAMARRWIHRPFDFVCLTDTPDQVPEGVKASPVPQPGNLKGWWSKIHLFAPNRFKGRVLYLDLDTLIVAPLDPIIDYHAQFALAPHAGTFNGKGGLQVVKRFNSSVMVWDAGTQDALYNGWTPAVASVLWGDQDYIGMMSNDGIAMPASWYPRLSEFEWPNVPEGARVVLCKKPKNHEAAKSLKGFAEAWG